MSWGATKNGLQSLDELDDIVPSPQPLADEPRAQFELAKTLVEDIVESDVIGEPPYNVSMSGHAKVQETDHPKASLTVSITQA